MIIRNNKIIFLIVWLILLLSSQALALKENTHTSINERVALIEHNNFSLNSYLINNIGLVKGVQETFIGIDSDNRNTLKTIVQWLGYGGEQEDRPGNWYDYVLDRPSR